MTSVRPAPADGRPSRPSPADPPPPEPAVPAAPGSPAGDDAPTMTDVPVEFVCEDDVRQAVEAGRRIAVNDRTIITPAARDLAERRGVFVRV